MKPVSDELFLLIKSLTKSEKRYFHQFAQRHVKGQGNNYLKLFQAIEQQKTYDEDQLKEQFCDEKFARYFPVAKRYLYQQITESLHQFHLAGSVEAQVRKDLHIVKILLTKNLYSQAQKLLKRIKKQIEQYELFTLLPDCLMLERQAWDQRFYKNASPDAPQSWKHSMEQALDLVKQETEFAFFSSMISRWHYQKITLSQEKEQEKLEELVRQFQQTAGRSDLTFRSQMAYLRAMSTYYFMKAQPQSAYDHNQQLLQLFEQNPDLLQLYSQQYLSVLNNFLIDNHQLKKYDVLEAGIQKLRNLPHQKAFKRMPSLPQKVFELSTLLELNTFIDQHQYHAALQRLPAIQKELKSYQNKVSKHYLLTFYYLIALIYFENQQFAQCQIWLNRLRQDNAKNMLEELLRFANLLYLATHYELGHYELLNHLILSARRKHSQMNRLYKTEKLLFSLLRQLTNAATKQEKREHFNNFKHKLLPIVKKQEEQRVFNYFDWVRWAEGHLGD